MKIPKKPDYRSYPPPTRAEEEEWQLFIDLIFSLVSLVGSLIVLIIQLTHLF